MKSHFIRFTSEMTENVLFNGVHAHMVKLCLEPILFI